MGPHSLAEGAVRYCLFLGRFLCELFSSFLYPLSLVLLLLLFDFYFIAVNSKLFLSQHLMFIFGASNSPPQPNSRRQRGSKQEGHVLESLSESTKLGNTIVNYDTMKKKNWVLNQELCQITCNTWNYMLAVASHLIRSRNVDGMLSFKIFILLGHFLKIHFYKQNLVHIASQASGKNANNL